MRHGSLFSGIGGFDLAAEWMGWENVFHCEWNEFGQKILKHYWPEAISYADITKTDFTIHRGQIDILTGGFPCQPYSMAGKRKGKEDDRHLWPEMLRAIREIQPEWIVGENVPGLINWGGGLVFEEVQAQMEAEGYEVQPVVLPACGIGADHRRNRVWFVAYSGSFNRSLPVQQRAQITAKNTDTNRENESRHVTNTNSERLQGSKNIGGIEQSRENRDKFPSRFFRTDWEDFPTQPPICDRNDGLPSKLDGITFSKWRIESIKAGGNAIVPQVAFEIFKAIEATK